MTRRAAAGVRSYLFAPGNHVRRAEKAFTAGADAAILDLEDAVAHAEKAAARPLVVAALERPRAVPGYVRVNDSHSPWWQDDLDAVVGPWLDGVVLPKVESAEEVRGFVERLDACERRAGLAPGSLDLMLIVETARGIVHIDSIAAASPRIGRIALGGGDYTNDLDLEWTADEAALAYARARIAHASRAAGIEPPVDTVVIEVRDQARFLESARNGRRLGFQGKLCIHPDQVAPCHAVFTPGVAEIARARTIVAAFGEAEIRGVASIQVDGVFVDYPVARRAQRILALAERLGIGAEPAAG
ncbi:MAG: Citrate lyase subunit beta [Steroidobacteraceae bacterium]|nr:Citrate lyase subunit beta [Steroidobacteraceae bacterium]